MIAATADGVVVGLRWRESVSGPQQEMFQVLRLQAGKVIDMQDHPNRRAALKAVGAPG
ncbi:MAG: hypothetical protein M3011_02365 [Actinomycetota bacterium]|nr:hypothetical protein [Actinomycetota bacterium]